jgi:hypothetical protein
MKMTDHDNYSNIWDTSASKDVVEVIGQKYAFSERLISLMMNDKAMQQRAKQQGRKRKNAASSNRNQSNMSSRRQRTTVTSQQTDPEKGMNDDSSTTTPVVPDKSTAKPPDEELELFYLLKNTVNYFSIDHTDRGRHCHHFSTHIKGTNILSHSIVHR